MGICFDNKCWGKFQIRADKDGCHTAISHKHKLKFLIKLHSPEEVLRQVFYCLFLSIHGYRRLYEILLTGRKKFFQPDRIPFFPGTAAVWDGFLFRFQISSTVSLCPCNNIRVIGGSSIEILEFFEQGHGQKIPVQCKTDIFRKSLGNGMSIADHLDHMA